MSHVALFILQTPCTERPAGREGSHFLAGIRDPGPLEKIGLLLHSRDRKEHVWHAGDAPGCLLVLPCPILIVSKQIQKAGLRRAW